MASIVDICNGALNQLGATTIVSLTEDSKNADLCNARYTQIRDSVFRSHPWNCLQKRLELSSSTDTPAWGFSFKYDLPSDCLRLLRILDYDSDHKVEGRNIIKQLFYENFIYSRITDPNQYDELLRETLSAALAADIAYAITSNNTVTQQNMYQLFQDKLRDARFVDSTEGYNTTQEDGMTDVIDAGTFINSRF